MAKYFLLVKIFSRGQGSSVTRAAAYRAGERIRDENSTQVHDYSDRTDVIESRIVLPSEYAGRTDMSWARNRSVLWNAVQRSGRQWNSRLAREVLVYLPPELKLAQRSVLMRSFSQELADRYHCAVDFAIHAQRSNANPNYHHGHILLTARQIGPEGLGARTTLELSGTERHQRGLGSSKGELLWTRERWAQVGNAALRNAGLTPDLDHRSYASRGIDHETRAVIPRQIFYRERRLGMSIPAGDALRLRHRERLEAQRKGPEELNRVLTRQREEAKRWAVLAKEGARRDRKIPTGAMSREQLNAKQRERYKAHKAKIREYRRANSTEISPKKREYRRSKAVEMARKEQLDRQRASEKKPVALGLAPPAPLAPNSPSPATRADSGVEKWLAYRESQKGVVRQDPIEKWKAYREAQLQKTESKSRDSDRVCNTAIDSDMGKNSEHKQKKGPKNDLGL